MSDLFNVYDDWLVCLLTWLDVRSICRFDVAVADRIIRLTWLKCLKSMDSSAFDKLEHTHSSIRWMIERVVCSKNILVRAITRSRITFETFLGIFSSLQSLNLRTSENITNAAIKYISERRPRIQIIDTCACFLISDSGISALAENFPELHTINIGHLTSSGTPRITNVSALALARGCPLIRNINLSGSDITDAGFLALMEGCPQLSDVNLSCCPKITDPGLIAFTLGCLQLSSIILRGCRYTDATISAVVRGCPLLSAIDLTHCDHITDATVIAMGQACPRLSSINVSGCKNISGACLSALAQDCPQLGSIDLSVWGFQRSITDANIWALVEGCPLLTYMNLSLCERLTDASLLKIGLRCPHLLGLVEVTDTGIIALAQGCPLLTMTGLEECRKITDSGVLAVAQHCPLLSRFNASEVKKITDIGVIALAKGCPQLSFASFSGCDITCASVLAIVKGCTLIRVLDVGHCRNLINIPDAVMHQIKSKPEIYFRNNF